MGILFFVIVIIIIAIQVMGLMGSLFFGIGKGSGSLFGGLLM